MNDIHPSIHPSMFSHFLRVVFFIFVVGGWRGGRVWVVMRLKRTLDQRLISANENIKSYICLLCSPLQSSSLKAAKMYK
jgi:hypothetical protein